MEDEEKINPAPEIEDQARARDDDAEPVSGQARANADEKIARLNETAKLMSQGLSDWDVRRKVAERFGIKPKTVRRYIAEVRKRLRIEFDPSKFSEHLQDSLNFYRSIYSDPSAPEQARIRARERADKLLTLEVPERIEVSHTVADPTLRESIAAIARKNLTDAELEALAAAGEIAKKLSDDEEDGG